MAFAYNAQFAFKQLQAGNLVEKIFKQFFGIISDFERTFEIRRIIFGSTAIIKTDLDKIPDYV